MQEITSIVKELTTVYGKQLLADTLRIKEQTLSKWSSGKTIPKPESLEMLFRLMDVEWNQANGSETEKDLRVLSLFTGCGGMDLGFEGSFDVVNECINPMIHPDWLPSRIEKPGWTRLPSTRFRTVFANDIFSAGRAAWVPYFQKRGASFSDYHLESIVDLVRKAKEGNFKFPDAEIVIGGFPCQDFSVAGKRKGFDSHKGHHGNRIEYPTDENRGQLYMWMRHVIDLVRPKVFVAENVKGLVSLADAKEIIEEDFRNIGPGYAVVNARVLYAPDYGVPQTRERVIFLGFRKDALTKEALDAYTSKGRISEELDPYPLKTHQKTASNQLLPYVTVQQCLKGLVEPESSIDLTHKSYSKAKYYGKHCQGQSEVKLDNLGPTIRAEHHGNIEFRRLSTDHGGKYRQELLRGFPERRLSVRECARIQTFPDDYDFVRPPSLLGKKYKLSSSEGYKVIGNAVPPLLAMHIAWRLQELWPRIMKGAKNGH